MINTSRREACLALVSAERKDAEQRDLRALEATAGVRALAERCRKGRRRETKGEGMSRH